MLNLSGRFKWPLSAVKRNVSFLVLAGLSGAYFSASMFAKNVYSENNFFVWNLFLTYAAVCFTFIYFGAEQMLLRCSDIVDGTLVLPKLVLVCMACGVLLFLLMMVLLVSVQDDYRTYKLPALICGFAIAVSVFSYNCLRLLGLFVRAQMVLNGWKLLLAIMFMSGLAAQGSPQWFFAIALTLSGAAGLVVLWSHRERILVVEGDGLGFSWSVLGGFALSLFVLMLMSNVDRFLFLTNGYENIFSDYVYTVTLLVMPFALLSNYFGFKEVAGLKVAYRSGGLRRKALYVLLFSSLAFIFWVVALDLASDLVLLDLSGGVVLPCLVIVSAKCVYSLYSAMFGLQGKASEIVTANITSLVFLAVLFIVFTFWLPVTMIAVLWGIASMWVLRLMVYRFYVSRIADY